MLLAAMFVASVALGSAQSVCFCLSSMLVGKSSVVYPSSYNGPASFFSKAAAFLMCCMAIF